MENSFSTMLFTSENFTFEFKSFNRHALYSLKSPSLHVLINIAQSPLFLSSNDFQKLLKFLGWEDPLEEEMATHSVFLPGKSHGWRTLAGYNPKGDKELDTTRPSKSMHAKETHKHTQQLFFLQPIASLLDSLFLLLLSAIDAIKK